MTDWSSHLIATCAIAQLLVEPLKTPELNVCGRLLAKNNQEISFMILRRYMQHITH